ncbi:tetratricopeptide repeat protein [Hyphococcus flavus]|uniref:Tetratricopeptide repeat protein n=1 Tax=Hyphococcus flavus TaxID=1866326 RepID=A0AAE9ZDT9_9PROT|nr:tetratricopeptide repeat protein [Hyphococcus flavus]WDI30828.1 tetratricopeptide repeat protein [Hyphococcus flavus]
MIDLKSLIRAVTAGLLSVALCSQAAAAPSGGSTISEPEKKEAVDVQASFAAGVQAIKDSDYKLAEKKLGEVLRVSSDHPEANYYMGVAKVGRGKEKSSVRYFKKAIKERSNFVEAYEQLALVFVALEKQDEAQEQLERLRDIRTNCDNETCQAELVERADQSIANVEAAMAGTNEASMAPLPGNRHALFEDTSSDTADVLYGEAVRLINQSRFAEAIDELYAAQAIIGPHADVLNYLGYAHRKLGVFDKAKSYYASALKLEPDHLGANEYLGELYLELGDVDAARKQLQKLEKICSFGCAEREDLARLIAIKESTRTARVK